ncbi:MULTISPECIES: hypothetical protein [Halomonas]|uniref:Uncharacterized protein n=1 Tax=Halomonas litopenaei TaxID=2109328 RepID=A0ABX5IWA3_9GAMM|nr:MULTISPECIES: hypothetical protein [Halomonas]MBR9770637.1 hypothetical protein [Gammaproteobacteria bacterium]MAR71484.1 hypothetical protein [Halomonas sp.]MBS8270082.1 hypothetical protein [Halomonas litopenaei]MBY5943406.1 hypothetical protein [Halomonas sp. DP5N14-9]MBY6110187.1 hypothetical protein [Halomonas sp. DP1Y21-3]
MRRLLAACLLCVSASALADGQATLVDGSGDPESAVTARWIGDQLRLDFPRHAAKGYLLLRDGKGHVVTNFGGQTVVLGIRDVQSIAGQLGGQDLSDLGSYQAQQVLSLEPVGTRESVAGIEGEVYRLDWITQEGDRREDELVLSQRPEVIELLRVVDRYQSILSGQPDPVAARLEQQGLGLLRFGDKFQVASLTATSPDPALLALPSQSGNVGELLRSVIQ